VLCESYRGVTILCLMCLYGLRNVGLNTSNIYSFRMICACPYSYGAAGMHAFYYVWAFCPRTKFGADFRWMSKFKYSFTDLVVVYDSFPIRIHKSFIDEQLSAFLYSE
jgi:hypothetical protein